MFKNFLNKINPFSLDDDSTLSLDDDEKEQSVINEISNQLKDKDLNSFINDNLITLLISIFSIVFIIIEILNFVKQLPDINYPSSQIMFVFFLLTLYNLLKK